MSTTVENGLDLASQRITSVGTPTATGDAVTMSYSDSGLFNRKPTTNIVVPDGYCVVLVSYLSVAGANSLTLQGDAVLKVFN